jgi:DNA polymerase-3 subunit epsilon
MSDEPATALADLDAMATQLEASGHYRVLRRAPPVPPMPTTMNGLHRGVIVDIETTGLDPQAEIIQLAILPFAYDTGGRVLGADSPFVGLEDPFMDIPPKVTRLTGLTTEMVYGQILERDQVEAAVGSPSIVIAHHAAFDRPFLERRFEFFSRLPFACSMQQVNWEDEGFEGTRLSYLLMKAGLFHRAHDAGSDCAAVLSLLDSRLPSGVTALSVLLNTASRPKLRFWAVDAAIEFKEILKQRGYRWNPGDDGRPRAWFKDVAEDASEAERAFLDSSIYRGGSGSPVVTTIDAFNRFSRRC